MSKINKIKVRGETYSINDLATQEALNSEIERAYEAEENIRTEFNGILAKVDDSQIRLDILTNSEGSGSIQQQINDSINSKQDKLVSGTNIKTINGESILGEGNINIESGSEQVQSDWNETDTASAAYITNKPNIPTKTSELENDSEFLAKGYSGYSVDTITIRYDLKNSTGNTLAWSYADKYIRVYDATKEDKILDIHASGDGTKFLSDDGTYKEISSNSSSSSGNGAYSEVNHGTSDTTFTLTPNTFHVWDEVTELNLTFGEETEGVANEFLFQFTSGSTATTLILPDTIKWANDSAPIIGVNMIYQVSILKGLASVLEFVVDIDLFPLIITDENINDNYLDVYNYLVSTYSLTNASSDSPNYGLYINETINIEATGIYNYSNGIVKKISLYNDQILLWTDASINYTTVVAINSSGIIKNYNWD